MDALEYVFRIDAFTPETLPMARLAEYLAALADLIGSRSSTHLLRIESGSARLVHSVAFEDAPKVQKRIHDVALAAGPKDAQRGFNALDELLANDNAVGQLIDPGGEVVIPFPGRNRPKPLNFPGFRQDGAIEGVVVSIGGKDQSAHAILQDSGITYSGCTLSRDLARQLARYLYGPKIRLHGNGRWDRSADGVWKLGEFRVSEFEALDESALSVVLDDLRTIAGDELRDDAPTELLKLRVQERS